MKISFSFLLILFISFQTFAQSEGGDGVPVNNTKKTKVDTGDLASKIVAQIDKCKDIACFVTFYNKMAKVTSGFKKPEAGKKITAEILKLMDNKKDGVLFDIYIHNSNIYRKYFIECAKLLSTDLQAELRRKSQEYLNKTKN